MTRPIAISLVVLGAVGLGAAPPRHTSPAGPAVELVLRGTVVTPIQVIADGEVEIAGDRITSISSTPRRGAVVIDGVILPGLIDLHNHYTWNVLPRWKPPTRFGNRYEWQEHPEYALALSGPHITLMAADFGCDMNRYAEIKAIVHGATAGVGGFGNPAENACIVGLLRNLDLAAELPGSGSLNAERLRNVVFPFEQNAQEEDAIRGVDPQSPDASKNLRAVVMHVGEGVDAASRREFRMLKGHAFLRPGVTIAHAVEFGSAQFAELAAAKVGLVWSPRSNLELYGRTADVVSAKAAGVMIAIAPDWSPTGGGGMLDELTTAWKLNVGRLGAAFSEVEMFRMASSNPAQLAAVSGTIGGLTAGSMADLLVLRRKGKSAYQSVVRSNPGDVLLVIIGGRPLYGEAGLMAKLLPGVPLESVTVCGEQKALNISGGFAGPSFGSLRDRLATALRGIGSGLAPLAECQ